MLMFQVAAAENVLLRMQQDLERALHKPVEQRGWVMVIDTRKCIKCEACVVACIAENVLPPGVYYRWVPEVEVGEYPNVRRIFMPANCMQCDKPPCMEAIAKIAPGAIYKRPDGIVAIDYTKFPLCGKEAFEAAAKACPYHRALYYDDGRFYTEDTPALQAYETRPNFEYGRHWFRTERRLPVDTARKCHFCLHRLEAGMLPACVTTCVGEAMHFGDLNDPESLVSQMLKEQKDKVLRVKESAGTEPRVYYLSEKPEECRRWHP